MQKAYMSSACYLNTEQYSYILDLTKDWNRQTRHMLLHILSTSFSQFSYGEYIPFPWTLMERKCPDRDMNQLSTLVNRTDYSWEDHICREYAVKPEIVNELLVLTSSTYVNAMTGKKALPRHKTTDNNNHTIPCPLVLDMFKCLSPQPINRTAINTILLNQKELLNSHIDGISTTNARRLRNDIYNLESILAFTDKDDLYSPQYKMCSTGRVYQYNSGGFQNLRSELKALVLSGITYYNYDLSSAQPRILQNQFQLHNIDCPWLDTLLISDKQSYASEINIPLKLWKTILCSIIFGASFQPLTSLEDFITQVENEPNSVAATLVSGLGNLPSTYKTYINLQEQFSEFYPQIKKYFRSLQSLRKAQMANSTKGGYFRNALNLPTREKQGNKLAAHVIQGIEQLYIDTLIILCAANSISVYAHEFDGLITNQPIPQQLIDQVASTLVTKGITSNFQLELKSL